MSTAPACTLGCTGATAGLPRQAAPGLLACHECAEALRGVLADLERLYDALDVTPGASGTTRHAPGFGPRSPAVDELLAHRDLRTADGGRVLAAVESWARAIREDLSIDVDPDQMRATVPAGRVTLARELATIRFHWHWIMSQPWCDEFAAEMRQLRGQLRAARRELDPVVRLGGCPIVVDIDDDDPVDPPSGAVCGEPLHVRPGDTEIRCRGCGATWHRERWHLLGQPWADYATLTEQLGVPVGTLRRWRHEDGWQLSGTPSRRLVARADALASYARRYGLEPAEQAG